jgi:hypothetical protein
MIVTQHKERRSAGFIDGLSRIVRQLTPRFGRKPPTEQGGRYSLPPVHAGSFFCNIRHYV